MRKVILVKLENNDSRSTQHYAYFTDDPTIKVGDYVLVATKVNQKFYKPNVAVVTVCEGLSVSDIQTASVWIVQKIDLTEYIQRSVVEAKITEIRNQLRQRKDQVEDMELYARLSQTDPVIGQLLKELQSLDPSVPKLT